MKRLLPSIGIAAGLGILAIWIPVLINPPAEGYDSWMRAAAQYPSVWAFQGLFVAGFLLGIFGRFEWIDLPLLALSMIALFPVRAGLLLATGSFEVDMPRELYLHAAWLMPALFGLATGELIGQIQRKALDRGGNKAKGGVKGKGRRRR